MGKVDCTVEKGLSRKYVIKSFPTIKIFLKGTDKTGDNVLDYKGKRDTESIVRYA